MRVVSRSGTKSSSVRLVCKEHSAWESVDIVLLLSLLLSFLFLLFSFLSHLFTSLSLLHPFLPFSLIPFFFLFLSPTYNNNTRCFNSNCLRLKNATEFDLRVHSEQILRERGEGVQEVDGLPWKGGSEGSLEYEVLRVQLRKMAPVNGRAVLVFRDKCGCPLAKLEGWNRKRPRKHQKGLALSGGDK